MLMNLHSRKIVGWSLKLKMEEALVIAALRQAIKERQPSTDLMHVTDRGGRYAGTLYRKLLSRAGMRQSMSRAGDCNDTSSASFMHSLLDLNN